MDLVFVLTGLSLGGAEIQVVQMALRHHELGRRVAVISMVANGSVLKRRLQDSGVPVFELSMPRGRPTLTGFVRAVMLLRRMKPRILHGHMFHANILVRLLRILVRPELTVCTAHNSNEGPRHLMLVYRITNGLGDAMTNVSEVAARELERRGAAPAGTIRVIWNCVDTDRFRKDPAARRRIREEWGVADSTYVFAGIGRLVPQKDFSNLLHAFSQVNARVPDARLVIAGDGELRGELEQIARENGTAARVLWLGERMDVEQVLNGADAFVLSSAYEGFGLVVGEAMAIGLPVVATRCWGPEEVLGPYGRLVPPGDATALAQAMSATMLESREALAVSAAGMRTRTVQKFSIAAAINAWDAFYSEFGVKIGSLQAGQDK